MVVKQEGIKRFSVTLSKYIFAHLDTPSTSSVVRCVSVSPTHSGLKIRSVQNRAGGCAKHGVQAWATNDPARLECMPAESGPVVRSFFTFRGVACRILVARETDCAAGVGRGRGGRATGAGAVRALHSEASGRGRQPAGISPLGNMHI